MKYILLSLCFLLAYNGLGQELFISNYNSKNALPSDEIYKIIEDTDGYIWIGTDRGLVRYDGEEFKTFTVREGLTSPVVFDIHENKRGEIWAYTLGEQLFKSKDKEKFSKVDVNLTKVHEELKGRKHTKSGFERFSIDSLNNLYFSNFKFHFKLDAKGKVTELETQKKSDTSHIFINESTPYSTIKHQLDLRSEFACLHHPSGYSQTLPINPINAYDEYNFNPYLSILGLSYLEDINCNKAPHKLFEGQLHCYNYTPLPTGWLLRYYKHNSHYRSVIYKAFLQPYDGSPQIPLEILNNAIITNIFVDSRNGCWLQTLTNGIYHIPSFAPLSHISDEVIYGIVESDTELRIQVDQNIDTIYRFDLPFVTNHQPVKPPLNIAPHKVYDKDIGPLVIQSYQKVDDTLFYKQRHSINFFVNDTFQTQYMFQPNLFSSFCIDATRKLWAGGIKGLYSVKEKDLRLHQFENGQIITRVNHINFIPNSDKIVIATLGNGIFICSPDSILNHYTTENSSLNSDIINNFYFQNDSTLWIATINGINKGILNQENLNIFQVPQLVSTIPRNITQISSSKSNLILASNYGLISIPYEALEVSPKQKLPLVLQSIKVNDTLTSLKSFIKLPYTENNIEINYKAISYHKDQSIEYWYRIINKDSNWQQTKNTSLSLLDLPPGNYSFEIGAFRNEFEIGNKRLFFTILITPPFWQETWFFILCFVAAGLITFYFINRKIKSVQKQSAILTELAHTKLMAMGAQLNPHFIFNSLSALQYSASVNSPKIIRKSIGAFASLMRGVFDVTHERFIPIEEEINLLKQYLKVESLRFEKEIILLDIFQQEQDKSFLIPPMMLQPMVENAIKHGVPHLSNNTSATIKIVVRQIEEHISITIENKGEPIDPSAIKDKPGGIQLIKRRLKVLEGITGTSTELSILPILKPCSERGTLIKLSIPKISEDR